MRPRLSGAQEKHTIPRASPSAVDGEKRIDSPMLTMDTEQPRKRAF